MERIVTIELFGEIYKLKAGNDVGNVNEVADYLVGEVNRLDSNGEGTKTNVSKFSTLLVASLNISKEYMELKKKYSLLTQEASKRSGEIITSMDDFLAVDR